MKHRSEPGERPKYHLEFIESLQRKEKGMQAETAGFFDVISQSIDFMQTTIARLKLAAYSPDLIIEIPKNACSSYEFERASELVAVMATA